MKIRRCLIMVSCMIASGLALAGETEFEFEVALTSGYDSNPFKLADGERDGMFMQAEFEGGLEVELSRRNSFLVEAGTVLRGYDTDLSDADETRSDLEARFEIVPFRDGKRRVTLEFGTRFVVNRETFTGRSTGQAFQVDDGIGGQVAIPDRFDSDRLEGFFDVEWRLSGRTRLFLNTGYIDKDYVEDYDELSAVESLDYDSLNLEPGVRLDPTDALDFEVSIRRSNRRYDSRTALDLVGISVPGSIREYEYEGYRAAMHFRPEADWSLSGGVAMRHRTDIYAGYYDYDSLTVFTTYRFAIDDRNRFRVYLSMNDRDYDVASVSDEANGEIRSSETLRVLGAYSRELASRLGLTVEAVLHQVDNENPVYEYDRSQIAVWLTYQ